MEFCLLRSQFLLQSIATLVLITLGNVYLLVLVFVLTGIFLGLRHIYVCTARSMKRIEVTGKALSEFEMNVKR